MLDNEQENQEAAQAEQAQETSDKMLLRKIAEKDAEIAKLKKTTVPKSQYDDLLEDFADGKYAQEQPEPSDEEEVKPLEEDIKNLFAIGDKSIKKRVGNREAIKRQVEIARRIIKETGENPIVASNSIIDNAEKGERWLSTMEDALSKSHDDATFEAYFKSKSNPKRTN